MEEAKDKGTEPDQAWNRTVEGIPKREHEKRLLGGGRKRNPQPYDNKRKTRTGRIL